MGMEFLCRLAVWIENNFASSYSIADWTGESPVPTQAN